MMSSPAQFQQASQPLTQEELKALEELAMSRLEAGVKYVERPTGAILAPHDNS